MLGRKRIKPVGELKLQVVCLSIMLLSTFIFSVLGSTFFNNSAYADPNGSASSTADVVLNLTSAISIRTLDSTASSKIESLNLELTPTPSGRFVKDTTIVDVATSNATGYMLYMASDYTNPHTSTSESPVYTTDMVHSDASVASNYSIPTITPASGTTISEAEFSMANSSYKNRWGYSLTEKNVAGTYNAIPAHSSPDTINSTVSTAVEHSYTPVTVGVNVDTNTASGTYTNELEFTAIANALPTVFTLSYAPNTGSGDTASNMPEPQTIATVSSQYTFTIPTTIPTTSQEGYVLKEWNTKPDGTGDSYQPGDEFTIIADNSLIDPGARTLYAIWEESKTYTLSFICDSSLSCPDTINIQSGGNQYNYVILNETPTKKWRTFIGWSESADEIKGSGSGQENATDTSQKLYIPGDIITLTPSEQTLYAFYTKDETFTINGVTFTSNIQGQGPLPNSSNGNISGATNNMCTALGSGWHIPTLSQFNTLTSTDEGKEAVESNWGPIANLSTPWFWTSTFASYDNYGYGVKAYWYQYRMTDYFSNPGTYAAAHNIVCAK